MAENLTDADIKLLQSITMDSIFKFNGVEIVKTEVSGVDEYVKELLSINLYEMIFNFSEDRLQSFEVLAGDIDVFGAINYISSNVESNT